MRREGGHFKDTTRHEFKGFQDVGGRLNGLLDRAPPSLTAVESIADVRDHIPKLAGPRAQGHCSADGGRSF